MTRTVRFVARVAVLVALVAGTPVQTQTPEIDALRERAEQGDAEAQYDLGRPHRCHRDDLGEGPPRFRVCGGISTFITILNARFLPMFRSCLCPAYR